MTMSEDDFKPLTVLPALTLIVVINLFALRAAVEPGTADAAHRPGHQAAGQSQHSAELPVLGQIQPFALTERAGTPLTQAQLQGKVWIADFIFTTCPAECPKMSAEMQKLQDKLDSAVHLVSFSVDPETDTPEKLRTYADKYGADKQRWLFGTGKREDLYKLAGESFKLAVQDLRAAKGPSPFLHSPKFVLVDGQMRIRGYYDSNDPADIRTLIEKDVPRLLHP